MGWRLLIGTLVGITAGYFRGWVGSVLMRFTDLMMAFPALLLAICLAAIFQPSLWIVALVIALVNWVQTARVIYTETTSLATRDFIAAERTLGAGTGRILFRHILPHLVPTIIVWGTLGISTTVLLEATLSFLGVGVQPPTASWGNIIYENQTYFPIRAVAGVHSGCRHHPVGAGVQSGGRCVARCAGPDPTGARLMPTYILRRLLQSALILLGVSFITFFLLFVLPADPVRQIAGRSATCSDGGKHPARIGAGSAVSGAVWPLPWRLGAGRSRPQLSAKIRSLGADRLAPACHSAADGRRDLLRVADRACDGHHRRPAPRQLYRSGA